MELWQQWWILAQESQQGAKAAEEKACLRSAVSRYYYAAFQAATAVLHYVKLTPPEGEQGWSHQSTPDMLEEHLRPYIPSRATRHRLRQQLRDLYKYRISADYKGNEQVDASDVQSAKRIVGFITSQIESVLPGGG